MDDILDIGGIHSGRTILGPVVVVVIAITVGGDDGQGSGVRIFPGHWQVGAIPGVRVGRGYAREVGGVEIVRGQDHFAVVVRGHGHGGLLLVVRGSA